MQNLCESKKRGALVSELSSVQEHEQVEEQQQRKSNHDINDTQRERGKNKKMTGKKLSLVPSGHYGKF